MNVSLSAGTPMVCLYFYPFTFALISYSTLLSIRWKGCSSYRGLRLRRPTPLIGHVPRNKEPAVRLVMTHICKFGSTDYIFRVTPRDNGLTTRLVSHLCLWTCIFSTASLYISPTQL